MIPEESMAPARAVSCAIYAAAKYYRNPEEAVIKSIHIGKDFIVNLAKKLSKVDPCRLKE